MGSRYRNITNGTPYEIWLLCILDIRTISLFDKAALEADYVRHL